jgi:uncharacterized protein with HEPN domain
LEEMRGALLAIKSYELHGRDHPAVVKAVVSSLVELGNLTATLPAELLDSQPDVAWDVIIGLREWSDDDAVASAAGLWTIVDDLLPLVDTLLAMRLRMPHEPEPTMWFEDPDSERWDSLRGDEPGSVGRESSVHVNGSDYSILVRSQGGVVEIQLSPDVGSAIGGSVPLSTMFKRAGIGRVRKDCSTPLEPRPDQVWIQAKLGEAVLVVRFGGPDHAAFFRLGELSQSTRALGPRNPVLFFLAEDYLPEARWSRMLQLVRDQKAWGGLVTSTIDG